jgi:hypothetical protein
MGLKQGDWVFCIDADTFTVTPDGSDMREAMEKVAIAAGEAGRNTVGIRIPEVWDLDTRPLQLRTDGFWNTMRRPDFVRWNKRDTEFNNKSMGCGSTPKSNYRNQFIDDSVQMLHFGYAIEEDRIAKHTRYTSLRDHGHNESHIQSIVSRPSLTDWTGPIPDAYMGVSS